jgi:integrase
MATHPPTELKRDHDSAYVFWKGRKWYFGRWGSREAAKAFAKWLLAFEENPTAPAPPHLITIGDCAQAYLLHAERYYSVDGVPTQEFVNVRAAIGHLLQHAMEDQAIKFGPKRLKEIQRALAAETIKDADGKDTGKLRYSRNTINKTVDRIRRCLRWCVSEEFIPPEVVTALEMVDGLAKGRGAARETEPVRPVAIETVRATLQWLSPTVGAMVQVQLLCAMRPQDVCGMTTGAVDRTGDIWLYRPAKHKGAHRGQLLVKAIPVPAQKLLEPFLRPDEPDAPLFSPLDSRKSFGNAPKGATIRKHYTTASYGKSIVYAIAAADKAKITIPHWQPNQLRHTMATDLRRTVGIESASEFLGHARPDTTLIYAEQTEQALREIARGIVSPLDQQEPPAQAEQPPDDA